MPRKRYASVDEMVKDLSGPEFYEFFKAHCEEHPMSNDPINPDYYKRDGIECIEAIEAAVQPIADPSVAFAVGSTIKYMWRAFEKHQSPVPCLLKARWFLNRALRLLGHQDDGTPPPEAPPAPAPRKFKAGDRVALVRGCHDTHGVVVGSDLIDGRVCVNWPYGPNVMECPGALMLAPVEPAPAPPPAGLDLSRVAGYVRRDGVLHLYERATDAQADINQPGWAEGAIVKGVALHAADGRTIDAREATPPTTPPAPAIPELPKGETPTVPGIYVVRHPHGTVGAYDIQDFNFWASRLDCRFAGPIPLPSFARDGREGGQDA